MPVTGADRGEKLLHVGRVGEQLPVHVPRIPVDQHPAQIERDGLDLLLLAGHAATVPAAIAEPHGRRSARSRTAAEGSRAVQSWLCRRYMPPGGNERSRRSPAWAPMLP